MMHNNLKYSNRVPTRFANLNLTLPGPENFSSLKSYNTSFRVLGRDYGVSAVYVNDNS
jgi:hypothetical protein